MPTRDAAQNAGGSVVGNARQNEVPRPKPANEDDNAPAAMGAVPAHYPAHHGVLVSGWASHAEAGRPFTESTGLVACWKKRAVGAGC
jgi:hypothetical protein